MARSPKEAIVIVLDVGKPAPLDCDDSGMNILQKSRACVSMISQRKIFSASKDEVGLVLMGTEGTVNNLNYKHISVASNLQLASWDLIQSVENETKPSGVTADWLDAIVVALDFLREQAEGKKFTEWKLVLLSNLASVSDTQQVDIIIQNIKDLQVNLVVIGPDPSQGEADSGKQLIEHIVNQVDGVMSNFEDAMQQLMFYQKKAVRPAPWNADMDIGSNIKIPVSGYRKISSTALPTWKTILSEGEVAPLKERSYFKDDEMQTEVERSNLINGYKFGSTIVPIRDVDEAELGYDSGPRAFSIVYFTERANIQRHYLVGDSTYYFTARKGNQAAAEAFAALTQALHRLDMVAIVRKVYNKGNAPVMGALFPQISPSSQVLVFAQLPFAEDMREFIFPSLPHPTKGREERAAAVDQLIEAMSLEGDTLQLEELADPYRQHWYSCLAQRALHPSEPLPTLAPHLAAKLRCPLESHEQLASTLVKELSRLFPLEEVTMRQTRRAAHNIFKREAAADGETQPHAEGVVKPLLDQLARDVVEVGTLSPADDFLTLLKQGEPFPTVCKQIADVVEKLVICSFGQDDYGKAVEAVRVFRNKCRELNPQPYNSWLPQLRKSVVDNYKSAFLDLLKAEGLGPISSEENLSSDVSLQEAEKFFEAVSLVETAPAEGEMDDEDLFDQM